MILDAEIIEQDIQDLEKDLGHVSGLIHTQEENLRHLEKQAAEKGGESYIGIFEKRQLESIRSQLEHCHAWREEDLRKLADKRSELTKAHEIKNLETELEQAMSQRQRDRAYAIAIRLRSLNPLQMISIDANLLRFYWRMAIEVNPNDYAERRQSMEAVERICYEVGDEQGLQAVRSELAKLYEERGESVANQPEGNLLSAVDYYRRAYDKYGENGNSGLFDRQRVLGKLIHIHWNLRDPITALRYCRERIRLLRDLDRPREAQNCYTQAINICSLLPDESQRNSWERDLTELTLHWIDGDPLSVQ